MKKDLCANIGYTERPRTSISNSKLGHTMAFASEDGESFKEAQNLEDDIVSVNDIFKTLKSSLQDNIRRKN